MTGENFSVHNHQRKTTNIVAFFSSIGENYNVSVGCVFGLWTVVCITCPSFFFKSFFNFISAVMSIMHISEDKNFLTVVGVLLDA